MSKASFELHTGRITYLLGPSGCGKSTILRMIAGLEPVDEGQISVHGDAVSTPGLSIPPEQRGIGLVFQDNALFPHLNVRDNVGFGVQSLHTEERGKLVNDLLARFQIDHLAHAWPHTLSGGEQQRVAIARALAREPDLLLLDEPFSGLDGHLRAQIRRSLIADLRAVGATVLIVTHDPEEAMMCADDLILMAEGSILQTGQPEQCYNNPVSLIAARLLGDAVELPVTIFNAIASTPFGPLPAPEMPNGEAVLIVRPGDLIVADEGISATVVSAQRLGHEMVAAVATGAGEFTFQTSSADLTIGQAIQLQVRSGVAHFLKAGAKT